MADHKMLGRNFLNHSFKIQIELVNLMSVNRAQKVNKISGPAADVRMVYATLVVVGNIHGAEHVAKVNPVTVGQVEVVDVLKRRNLRPLALVFKSAVVGVFPFSNKLGKSGIFVTGHNVPGTGIIAVNTGTDVLDDQHHRISAGILSHVLISQLLQCGQPGHELIIRSDDRGLQHGNLFICTDSASRTLFISFPTNRSISRSLGFILNHIVSERFNFEAFNNFDTADRAVRTTCKTRFFAHRGFFFIHDFLVSKLLAFRITATIDTSCGQCAGRRSHFMFNSCLNDMITASAMYRQIRFYTRRLTLFINMSCFDVFLFYKSISANRALLAVRQTIGSAGLRIAGNNFLGVSKRFNDFLLNGNRFAQFALLAFRKTGRRAGRRNSFKSLLLMLKRQFSLLACTATALTSYNQRTQRGAGRFKRDFAVFLNVKVSGRRFNLRNEYCITYITMLSFGKSGRYAIIGNYRCINNDVVSVLRNNFLYYRYFTATETVLTFGKTGFGTSCRNRIINDLIMSERRDYFLSKGNLSTDSTLGTLFKTGFCASRVFRRKGLILMSSERGQFDRLLGNRFTDFANLALRITNFSTGRLNRRNINLGMSLCSNLYISSVVTARTLLICIPANRNTVRLFRFYFNDVMIECGDFFKRSVVAARAGYICLPSGFQTGCCLGIVLDFIMSKCRNLFIGRVITSAAIYITVPADFCTGRRLGRIDNIVMSQCSLLYLRRIVTSGAGHISVPALFSAGGGQCFIINLIMS